MKSFKTFLESREQLTAVMVVTYDNKALILRRGKTAPWMPGKWNLPGGGVDEGETPKQAAIRECQEEAGITPKNVQFITSHADIYAFSGTTNSDHVTIRANHGIIESDAYEWISINELVNFQFAHPFIPVVIQYVLSKGPNAQGYKSQTK